MDLRVSVIVATLNRAKLLAGALDALIEQDVPDGFAWEVVVVDNGSRDETQTTIARAAARAPMPIRTVVEPARGLSNARNRGLGVARGAIVAFTDDDVLPPSDWVATVEAAMERWGADIVGGRILPVWPAEPPDWLTTRRQLMSWLAVLTHPTAATLSLPRRGAADVWGANMAFRRTVFEVIGEFDPRLGMNGTRLYRGEESDLIERALRHGFRVVYEPDIVVHHRIGSERIRRAYFRRLAFDAGHQVASLADVSRRRTLLGAPLRHYRVLLRAHRVAAAHLRGRPNAFDRELRWRFRLGRLVGHWARTLRRTSRATSELATRRSEKA